MSGIRDIPAHFFFSTTNILFVAYVVSMQLRKANSNKELHSSFVVFYFVFVLFGNSSM